MAASHSRAVLSELAVRIVLPSGLKATVRTEACRRGRRPPSGLDVAGAARPTGWPGRRAGRLVSRLGRHPQRLDGPEHPGADLPLLEGDLAALEIEPRQPAVRLGQRPSGALSLRNVWRSPASRFEWAERSLELGRQAGDLSASPTLCSAA